LFIKWLSSDKDIQREREGEREREREKEKERERKIKEAGLGGFGHVLRLPPKEEIKRMWMQLMVGRRSQGKQKLRWGM